MELIYTNDLCTGCNKCVRGCPVLTANIATQEGYVTVDPDKCCLLYTSPSPRDRG